MITAYDFDTLFDQIEFIMQASCREAAKIYKADTNRLDRLVSSIRLVTCADSPLVSCFVGSVTLVTDESLRNSAFGAGEVLGSLMRNTWRERLKFRAEFNLTRISVPAIEAACALPCSGIKLAANILLAAQTAVSTRIPQNVRDTLCQLAGIAPGSA